VGHNPTIRYTGKGAEVGAIQVTDADYVTIRKLKFDGAGVHTSLHAIMIYADTKHMVGITVENVTVTNWGGTQRENYFAAIIFRPSWGTGFNNFNVTGTIRNNILTNNVYESIRLTKTKNALVENNIITGARCGRKPDTNRGATGIKDSQRSIGTIARGNIIRDFEPSTDCPISDGPSTGTWAGIYCDTGPTWGMVEMNDIFNIDQAGTFPKTETAAVFIESLCHDWTVRNNVIHHIGKYGIRNGSGSTGNPDRTIILNNTIAYIAGTAVWIRRGNNLTIKNNILHHNNITGIEVNATAVGQGPHQINYNLYWDSVASGNRAGRWGNFTTVNFAAWKSACGCDAQSLNTNPLFKSATNGLEDFGLSSSSPARGAGQGGIDLGAYRSVGIPTAPGLLNVIP
jgi:hypothetical protein